MEPTVRWAHEGRRSYTECVWLLGLHGMGNNEVSLFWSIVWCKVKQCYISLWFRGWWLWTRSEWETICDGLVTLQNCVVQSEAEYVAAAKASKEAIWLKGLVMEMGFARASVNLHCDSRSAWHLAVNQVMASRVKHIDVRYHFIRQVLSNIMVELVKIDGTLNPAALTKVVLLESFLKALC
jgi:hypothetical protein